MKSGQEMKVKGISDLQRKKSKQKELPLDCLKTDVEPQSGILIYSASFLYLHCSMFYCNFNRNV